MSDHDDPVDAVILAFLDHLEGAGPRPALDHLAEADRHRVTPILTGMASARGIDPRATRPSVEALLADTPLAGVLSTTTPAGTAEGVRRLLATVDSRASVILDGDDIVWSYLDLRARFLLVPVGSPLVTPVLRVRVQEAFATDPDTSRVGIVATGSDELLTQMLAADDLGDTITTPRGEPPLRFEPLLPLAAATRLLLEQGAPEWPAFDFDHGGADPLDLPSMVSRIARTIIAREAARSYRGEKRRAYQDLVGRESAFVDLVVRVFGQDSRLDLDREAELIVRAAA